METLQEQLESMAIPDIEEQLRRLPFVSWDRFAFEGETIAIFGWIARDTDAYKDFVLLEMHAGTGDVERVTTSSAKYSKEIADIMLGEGNNHTDCIRAEDWFDVPNIIKLREG